MSKSDNQRPEPKWVRFVTGGLGSCTAEIVTLPIDTAKVRLQVQTGRAAITTAAGAPVHYNGLVDCLVKVVRYEGVSGLWKGLSPALMRQASYSSIRMGIYEPLRNVFCGGTDMSQASFLQKLLAGGSAGAIGIGIANPTELVKIRMQADRQGTRYSGVFNAFSSIYRTEGLRGLWTGVGPNIQRAFIVNAAELATYDQSKHMLVESGYFDPQKPYTHFAASFMAGFAAASASSPVDVIKNRLMSQTVGPAGERQYKNMLDCGLKTVQSEGVMALYKGFIPNWLRLGPWCIVMFMSYEQYREAAKNFY